MKLLILGGTRFLGRHLVQAAQAAGHTVTLFNRGVSAPDLYPEVEQIHGDRDGGLDALGSRRFDAVIDTCGYVPRLVGDAARFFADRAKHYTFISSISVYADSRAGMDESAPVIRLGDPVDEAVTPERYGGLKALCEEAAEAAMPGRVATVRAGMIVGPFDPTDRFTFWVRRVSRGGTIPVPEPQDRPMQLVHAGDLAAWVLRLADAGTAGTWNATGPGTPYRFGEFLDTCRRVSESDAEFHWMPDARFTAHGLTYWKDLPFIIDADSFGVMAVDTARAVAHGFKQRSLRDTVADTLTWDRTRDPNQDLQAGFGPEVEQRILATPGGV